MNTSDLLEQLLRPARARWRNRGGGGASAQGGLGGLGGLLGGLLGGGGASRSGAGGMVAWAACSVACWVQDPQWAVRRNRRPAGGTNYAALASLGMMAFQAFQAWQRSQATQQQQAPQQAMRTVDMLAGPEVEEHSHAILRAMIAAAKADGRFDDAETANDQCRNRPPHR